MLVFVNLLAGFVLFFVELLLLGFGQVTIVSGHVGFFLVVDVLLAIFQMRSLPRGQSTVLFAIGDAILLVLLAAIDLVNARMTGIDLSRACAGCVAVLGMSRGDANKHKASHCKD